MQADEEEYRGDEIVAVAADVAQHPPGQRGGGADEPDGDQDAQRKQQGNLEGAFRGDGALLVDEADDQRDAGEVAGAEHDAQDTPNDRGGQGDGGAALDGARQVAEQRLDHGTDCGRSATPSSCHLARMSSLGKKPS